MSLKAGNSIDFSIGDGKNDTLDLARYLISRYIYSIMDLIGVNALFFKFHVIRVRNHRRLCRKLYGMAPKDSCWMGYPLIEIWELGREGIFP